MNRFQEGSVLGGRYVLTARIASGGMGDVWEANDEVLSRAVAVKILRPSLDSEEVFARRFRNEATHTAGLAHFNIATVFDYGEEDDLAYLVMELVPGEPLSALVRREGALDPVRVRAIMGQAALALGAAHEAGVVHRDVKPANILLIPDGTVKLTDFGIARAVNGSGETQTGEILGTPHYLSPEQARGESATGASDLYALGIVGHELLTGRRPFDRGTPVATALAQVNDPPPPLPDHVPENLRRIIEECLSKKPDDRPRSARLLGEVLGMPDGSLPADAAPASRVLGDAVAGESAEDVASGASMPDEVATPRPKGGWPSDPTPTPTSVPVRPKGHVHWAWVPAACAAVLLVSGLWVGLAR
ncbi:MAG: serine/threonine-protein kinase [Ornithinibacter sp.]